MLDKKTGASRARPLVLFMALFMGLVTIFLIASSSAEAKGRINGLYNRYITPNSDQLRVFNCGGGLGIKVARSSHRPSVGRILICGARRRGKAWHGKILNIENGKRYLVSISKVGTRLKIQGCGLVGLICQSNYFTRAK